MKRILNLLAGIAFFIFLCVMAILIIPHMILIGALVVAAIAMICIVAIIVGLVQWLLRKRRGERKKK